VLETFLEAISLNFLSSSASEKSVVSQKRLPFNADFSRRDVLKSAGARCFREYGECSSVVTLLVFF